MKLSIIAGLASGVIIVACGTDKNGGADSAAARPTPAAATATSASAATDGESAAPITGQTIEVKMLQDAQGNYRFDPANLTIKTGDGVKFIMVSGGPHNVAFDPSQIPAAAKAQLSANMQQQVSELSSPMMMNPNETYTISFGKIPPGKYLYHCTPHLALGMLGTITVQ
jgi:plastocyanin